MDDKIDPTVNAAKVQEIIEAVERGETRSSISQRFGVSKTTIYNYITNKNRYLNSTQNPKKLKRKNGSNLKYEELDMSNILEQHCMFFDPTAPLVGTANNNNEPTSVTDSFSDHQSESSFTYTNGNGINLLNPHIRIAPQDVLRQVSVTKQTLDEKKSQFFAGFEMMKSAVKDIDLSMEGNYHLMAAKYEFEKAVWALEKAKLLSLSNENQNS